jgi:LysM repeat protein
MKIKILNSFIALILIFSMNLSAASEVIYIVKPGETLSDILFSFNVKPIYGKKGYLFQTLKLNPKISKNHHKIYPGMKIKLPEILIPNEAPENISVAQKEDVKNISVPEPGTSRSLAFKNPISHSDFGIYGTSRFMKVVSTDTSNQSTATMLSDAGNGFKVEWGQNWSDELRTILSLEKNTVRISESQSTTKSFTDRNQTLSNYEFGMSYKYSPRLELNSSVSYGESIVARTTNVSTVDIDKFISPKINMGIGYTALSRDELKLKILGEISGIIPSTQSSYSSKMSVGYKGAVGISDTLSIFTIKGELFYKNSNIKMTGASFDQTEVGISLGIVKDFGSN